MKNSKSIVFLSLITAVIGAISLFAGKYPMTLRGLMSGDEMMRQVFFTLRTGRTLTALIGGAVLGISGFVFQTVFGNPLASPDMIGVSSGASVGAAAGILFCGAAAGVTVLSFAGALAAMALALIMSSYDRSHSKNTIVLAGIAVHAVFQAILMLLKLTADPERELASIEFWMMGSLSDVSTYGIAGNLILCAVCAVMMFALQRQIVMLSADEGEAKTLGVSVGILRAAVLLVAALSVSAVVSITGIVSFTGLIAPHGARLFTRDSGRGTMIFSGILGAALLTAADILARCVSKTELPISIFTSAIGAPMLIVLLKKGGGER